MNTPLKIALVGLGRTGSEVERAAQARGHEVVARFDVDCPLRAASELAQAHVLIEFSLPTVVPDTLQIAATRGIPVVEGTTGWYDRLPELVRLPGLTMIYSPNFALGVHVFTQLVREAARRLADLEEFDVYLHEWHHTGKLDSPSGTARRLAEIVLREMPRKRRLLEDRCDGRRIDPDELHVTSTRVGGVPGIHEVGFTSSGETLTLRHQAHGRECFAQGAVRAAEWIVGRKGVFTLDDMLEGPSTEEKR
ncbi:MAG TPA: 4-hydroxy-tetrahydrodipicolinate reductase [Acidobacteriota bacterium]|jgi:4-hydroxy-tetrahydrodipicolinate reductase|nr:4-hydroxy-tetrahydrodipicolinate reductase [Acidobacteriota bacterium]